MKKILLLAILFFISFSGKAQIDTSFTPSGRWLIDSTDYSTNGYTLQIQKPQDVKIWVNGRDVSEIILIKPNGEFYYKPSAFCDCKKCKNFKGMKLMPAGMPQN